MLPSNLLFIFALTGVVVSMDVPFTSDFIFRRNLGRCLGNISFQAYALVDVYGIPGLVTDKDLFHLEQSFVVAYNMFVCNQIDAFRTLNNALVLPGATDGLGTNISYNLVPRNFTILMLMDGRCNSCSSVLDGENETTTALWSINLTDWVARPTHFPTTARRKVIGLRSPMATLYESFQRMMPFSGGRNPPKNGISKARDGILNQTGRELDPQPKDYHQDQRSLTEGLSNDPRTNLQASHAIASVCRCDGPLKNDFVPIVNSLFRNISVLGYNQSINSIDNKTIVTAAGGILSILDVTQVYMVNGCHPDNVTNFTSEVVLTLDLASLTNGTSNTSSGDNSTLDSLATLDLKALAQAFLESYNEVNHFSFEKKCDPLHREITSVVARIHMLTPGNGKLARVLQENTNNHTDCCNDTFPTMAPSLEAVFDDFQYVNFCSRLKVIALDVTTRLNCLIELHFAAAVAESLR